MICEACNTNITEGKFIVTKAIMMITRKPFNLLRVVCPACSDRKELKDIVCGGVKLLEDKNETL